MTTPARPRAAIYCRISKTEGTKIVNQEQWCRDLAASSGYDVLTVLTDNGISGSTFTERPAWSRLLELVEKRSVDVIVAVNEDRFTRQPFEKNQLTLLCVANDVRWHTDEGLTDPATADGEFFSNLRAAIAKMEVRRKSERQRRANRARAERGLPLSCTRPYGYLPGGLKLHPTEAPALHKAYETVAAGGSLYEVARGFNAQGLLTTRGNPWYFSTVRQSLLRPRNAGIVTYRGEVLEVEPKWEPLVDRQLFDTVGSILADPVRLLTNNREQRWLCSGIATCGVCSAPMRASGSASNRVYRCSSKQIAGVSGRHVSARVEELDNLVRDEVIAVFLVQTHRSRSTTSGELQDVMKLRAKLTANLTAQGQITDLIGDPGFNVAQMRERGRKLRDEEEQLRREIDGHARRSAQLSMYVSSHKHVFAGGQVSWDAAVNTSLQLRRNFDRLALAEQRALVRESVEVTVLPGRGPERFVLAWKPEVSA